MPWRDPVDLNGIPMWNPQTFGFTSGNSTGFTVSATFGGQTMIRLAQPDIPSIAQDGPLFCSTSTELVPDPVVISDGNHYYKCLGFTWPYLGITRADLKKAYQDIDGQASAYKTYAFKNLLDKNIRRIYDRIPFGEQRIDAYVIEKLKRRARDLALQHNKGKSIEEIEDLIERQMRAWGLEPNRPRPDEPVSDTDEPLDDEEPSEEGLSDEDATVPEDQIWGYLAWRSNCRDAPRLVAWRHLLIQAAREQQRTLRFAVGFHGRGPHEHLDAAQPDGSWVLYLHESVEPTEELAMKVIAGLS